jgi:O-antigen/teichoic acid export membrane protein
MSVSKNSIANYAGQIYRVAIGIVMLPLYLRFLGAEAYGLVGFFVLLNSWLMLLTAGVAPTLARQVAFSRGRGELDRREFREMLRSLEMIVVGAGVLAMLLIWIGSDWLAAEWLTVKTLVPADVAQCICLMGVVIGLGWVGGFYSSGVSGLERQIWLNGYRIGFATLRFGGAYFLLRWVSQDVVDFFKYQLVVSLIELIVIAWKFYDLQPAGARKHDPGLAFSWPVLRPVLPFAMGITYTSTLWVLMTQSDKLILSHVLSLTEFGYFSIVIVIANGVLQFSGPITAAVLPRLTMLHAQGNNAAMLALYRETTQFLSVIVFSVSGMLALYSKPLIFALTGSQDAAEWGAPALRWFALGNAILVIVGMQYSLQFVHGKLKMHVINTTINAVFQVPTLVFVAFHYGAVAVALAWFCIRLITFFVWPAIVHHKFAPGLHWKWLGRDVMLPLLGAALGLGLTEMWMTYRPLTINFESRLATIAILIAFGIGLLAVSSLFAREVRRRGLQLVKNVKLGFWPAR